MASQASDAAPVRTMNLPACRRKSRRSWSMGGLLSDLRVVRRMAGRAGTFGCVIGRHDLRDRAGLAGALQMTGQAEIARGELFRPGVGIARGVRGQRTVAGL